jgi:hypothetical protein
MIFSVLRWAEKYLALPGNNLSIQGAGAAGTSVDQASKGERSSRWENPAWLSTKLTKPSMVIDKPGVADKIENRDGYLHLSIV